MSEWRPIETAPNKPNGRVKVDLWVRVVGKPVSEGWRVCDCHLSGASNPSWVQGSKWITGRRFFNEDGVACYDPWMTDDGSVVATHWMPRPKPPAVEGDA